MWSTENKTNEYNKIETDSQIQRKTCGERKERRGKIEVGHERDTNQYV